jgi:hypothetical protein
MRREGSLLTMSLAVTAVLAATLSVAGCGSAAKAGTAIGPASRGYVDPAGWSLRYPSTMYVEHSSSGPGLAVFSEVTIASFAQQRAVHTGRTRDGGFVAVHPPLNASGRFPQDAVAFRMLLIQGGPVGNLTVADSRFPIQFSTFSSPQRNAFPVSDYLERGVPAERTRPIDADAQHYEAMAFIGDDASPQLRRALARVTNSLSFPRLAPGTTVGEQSVLEPASHYPVGSVTLVHAKRAICSGTVNTCRPGSEPFYLVHAPGRLHQPDLLNPCSPKPDACSPPGAFYALGWTSENIRGGYRSGCQLRLDRKRKEFYCANNSARWDRVGRVIRRPAGEHIKDPLAFSFAKVAWDGQVVMIAGVAGQPPAERALRMLWPVWSRGQAAPAKPDRGCGAKQVRLKSPTQVDGLLESEVIPVVITNATSTACSISGYPRIQLLNARRRPVAIKVVHGALGPKEPKRVSTVALAAAKGRATFGMSFVDHAGPAPASDCRKFHFIRVILPGQHAALTTASGIPTEVCDGRPNPWLYVSPIGP